MVYLPSSTSLSNVAMHEKNKPPFIYGFFSYMESVGVFYDVGRDGYLGYREENQI